MSFYIQTHRRGAAGPRYASVPRSVDVKRARWQETSRDAMIAALTRRAHDDSNGSGTALGCTQCYGFGAANYSCWPEGGAKIGKPI